MSLFGGNGGQNLVTKCFVTIWSPFSGHNNNNNPVRVSTMINNGDKRGSEVSHRGGGGGGGVIYLFIYPHTIPSLDIYKDTNYGVVKPP